MKPIQVNGWKITPCGARRYGATEPGFDVSHGSESYHYEGLAGAVEAAQRTSRESSDPITPTLESDLYAAVSEARRGGGEQGGVDYTLRGLVDLVRTAIEADREDRS